MLKYDGASLKTQTLYAGQARNGSTWVEVTQASDSKPCVQWGKGAKEQRKKEAPSRRSPEGKSL